MRVFLLSLFLLMTILCTMSTSCVSTAGFFLSPINKLCVNKAVLLILMFDLLLTLSHGLIALLLFNSHSECTTVCLRMITIDNDGFVMRCVCLACSTSKKAINSKNLIYPHICFVYLSYLGCMFFKDLKSVQNSKVDLRKCNHVHKQHTASDT